MFYHLLLNLYDLSLFNYEIDYVQLKELRKFNYTQKESNFNSNLTFFQINFLFAR